MAQQDQRFNGLFSAQEHQPGRLVMIEPICQSHERGQEGPGMHSPVVAMKNITEKARLLKTTYKVTPCCVATIFTPWFRKSLKLSERLGSNQDFSAPYMKAPITVLNFRPKETDPGESQFVSG